MAIQIDYTIKNASHTEFVVLYDQLKQLDPFASYRIIVLDDKPIRSLNANRYLWFIYQVISDHTGYTRIEIHAIMKWMFNMEIYFSPYFAIEDAESTTHLKSDKFWWYTKQVKTWANSWLGVDIPDRDDMTDEQKIAAQYIRT